MKLVVLLTVPLVGARVIGNQYQAPIVGHVSEDAVPEKPIVIEEPEDLMPGIGVYLTTSYAIAAARFQNGTIRNLAKLQGDAEYVDLMSRWMKSYSTYSWEDDW
jgi:hypothetical protein